MDQLRRSHDGQRVGWQSSVAARFGDAWYDQRRSAGLPVPAVSSRPVGMNLMIDPEHPDAARIRVSEPFAVPRDERLF